MFDQERAHGMMPLSEWSCAAGMSVLPGPQRGRLRGAYWSCRIGGCRHWTLVLSEMAGERFSISQPFYTRAPSSCTCNRFAPNTLSSLSSEDCDFISLPSRFLLTPVHTPKAYHRITAV